MNKFIELHLHLDGAITVGIAKQLAQFQPMPIPCTEEELDKKLSVPIGCQNLSQFLNMFLYPISLLQTYESLSESVKLVADNIQSQGVIYAEIRFAPQLHTKKKMTQEDAIKAVLDGLKKTSLKVNIILCFMRGDNNKAKNEETLELAKKYLVKDGGVVALDLAGDEAHYKTKDYKDLFAKAKEYNIPFTIHAGEADGADSVKSAIEFGAKRIGHGIRSLEDPEVIEMIKDRGITLEICPTSNRQTHVVDNMENYPFRKFLENGINVTLNTDDMGIERTTLPLEFEYMEKNFGLTYEEEKNLLLNSVNAAFTSDEVKVSLKKQLGF